MKLSETELKDFIKKARFIEYNDDGYDSNGNYYGSQIFQYDEKFYEIEMCSGSGERIVPSRYFDSHKGYQDFYLLREVEQKVEMVEVKTWKEIEK